MRTAKKLLDACATHLIHPSAQKQVSSELISCRKFSAMAGISMPSPSKLWEILKKEQIEPLDAETISNIWMQARSFYHVGSETRVATVIPAAQYALFRQNAAVSPMFVLPVFHGPNASETYLLQCQPPHVLFTSLNDFKTFNDAAAPYFTITHYTELMDDKKIVLVRGDILQPASLGKISADSLLRNAHDFYTNTNKHSFVRKFNHYPSEFDFKRLLDALGHDSSAVET